MPSPTPDIAQLRGQELSDAKAYMTLVKEHIDHAIASRMTGMYGDANLTDHTRDVIRQKLLNGFLPPNHPFRPIYDHWNDVGVKDMSGYKREALSDVLHETSEGREHLSVLFDGPQGPHPLSGMNPSIRNAWEAYHRSYIEVESAQEFRREEPQTYDAAGDPCQRPVHPKIQALQACRAEGIALSGQGVAVSSTSEPSPAPIDPQKAAEKLRAR